MIHPRHAKRALQSLRVLISLAVGLQVVLPTTAVPTFASSVTSITIAGTTNNGGINRLWCEFRADWGGLLTGSVDSVCRRADVKILTSELHVPVLTR